MKEVPVKIEHNNQWIVIKLGVGEDRIVFPAPVSHRKNGHGSRLQDRDR